ncbi:MAG: hypothetical protein MZV63_64665 [Marinilabiliales bacterium]|nr:hypothetical protein [Marinilabiliales bacterium]
MFEATSAEPEPARALRPSKLPAALSVGVDVDGVGVDVEGDLGALERLDRERSSGPVAAAGDVADRPGELDAVWQAGAAGRLCRTLRLTMTLPSRLTMDSGWARSKSTSEVGVLALLDRDRRLELDRDLAPPGRIDDRDVGRVDRRAVVGDEGHRRRVGVDDQPKPVVRPDRDRGLLQDGDDRAEVDEVDLAGGRVGRIGLPDLRPAVAVQADGLEDDDDLRPFVGRAVGEEQVQAARGAGPAASGDVAGRDQPEAGRGGEGQKTESDAFEKTIHGSSLIRPVKAD